MAVRNVERELEALTSLRTSSESEARPLLEKALSDKINVVVAKAAALIAELQLRELVPQLCSAFDRLLINPVKTDPQCWAKTAIAKALKDLDHSESTIFLKGIQHVQMEPVWGGQEDTAATLRATCGFALLQCTDLTREEKLWAIMRLLTESSASLRKDAALVLEALEGREAALLLRIKARMGDSDSTVTGQMFESLLRVEGENAVAFIIEFLRAPNPEVREEAALALGVSRLPKALSALIDLFSEPHLQLDHEILFRAISISRHEDAVPFLLETVRTRRPREALAALDGLKLHRDSPDIRGRVSEAVATRSENEIHQEFQRLFPSDHG